VPAGAEAAAAADVAVPAAVDRVAVAERADKAVGRAEAVRAAKAVSAAEEAVTAKVATAMADAATVEASSSRT
jgi:hypothetical protein